MGAETERPTDALLNDPLVEGLAWLWSRDPALARKIERRLDQVGLRTPPEPARDGSVTLSVIDEQGRSVRLHSLYKPLEEADRLVANFAPQDATAVFVYGLGVGHHVKRLAERVPEGVTVFVFEPSLDTILAALGSSTLSDALSRGRIRFLTHIDRPEWINLFTPIAPAITGGLIEVEHPPSVRAHARWFAECRSMVNDVLTHARTATNTLLINGRQTAQNVIRNLPWYLTTPTADRLAKRFAQQPALIVSAGPSLRKNRHLIREAVGRCVIIAVQTTLQPLLDIGVVPDFVTSLDYSDVSRRFYERLPRDLSTELIVDAKANAVIPDAHPGPVTMLGATLAEGMLRELNVRRPALRSGATVAHLAFYLAEHMACDPIIFVGQDLGFVDGLAYAPGTSYDDVWGPELGPFCTLEQKQWEQIARDRNILSRIPDIHGRPMYTEQRLLAYLRQFERDFAQSPARIIDATEGGARKAGTEVMSLAEALASFCQQPLRSPAAGHPGLSMQRIDAAMRSIEARRSEAEAIAEISRQTLPLLEAIIEQQADQAKVNRTIAQLDALRARMNDLGATYELITQLTLESEMNRFRADLAIGAADIDEIERQRRQTLRDIENVRAIQSAAEQFAVLMDEAMTRLAEFPDRTNRTGASHASRIDERGEPQGPADNAGGAA